MELADRLDAEIGRNAPIAARRRLWHLFGPSRLGRTLNVALRVAAVPLLAAVVVIGTRQTLAIPSLFIGAVSLLALMLGLTGLKVDAPRLTAALYRVHARSTWVLGAAYVCLTVACFLLTLLVPTTTPTRLLGVLATFSLALMTRQILTTSGDMFRRHFRRSVGAVLTQLLWLTSAWAVVLVIAYVQPPESGEERRNAIQWALGIVLVVAGYTAAVSRRRQRLYARIVDQIDAIVPVIEHAEQGGTLERRESMALVLTLDRLLGASVDSAFLALGMRFESLGLRRAVRAVASKALQLSATDQPSLLDEDQSASRAIESWSIEICRRYLRAYLVTLRGQIEPSEDVLTS